MRELKVVGHSTSTANASSARRPTAPGTSSSSVPTTDCTPRCAATRRSPPNPRSEDEVPTVLRPKDIQARIRAGASVEQVASRGWRETSARVERFAHPVLLERSRAAELATASHPVLADGPAVLTLLETVTTALVSRGLDPEATAWDAWRNEDGRWTVQLSWKAGRSDNTAHFRYTPGAHGGTATPFDDAAAELIDPGFDAPPAAVGGTRARTCARARARAGTRARIRRAPDPRRARARRRAGTPGHAAETAAPPQAQARGPRLGRRPTGRPLRQPALT